MICQRCGGVVGVDCPGIKECQDWGDRMAASWEQVEFGSSTSSSSQEPPPDNSCDEAYLESVNIISGALVKFEQSIGGFVALKPHQEKKLHYDVIAELILDALAKANIIVDKVDYEST